MNRHRFSDFLSYLPWWPTELTKSFLMTFILALSTPRTASNRKCFLTSVRGHIPTR